MKMTEIANAIRTTAKGSFHSAVWKKTLKTKKAFQNENIVKITKAVVRFGIEYDNMKAVQIKRESGELPKENAGLPWGEWKQYPYIITHKGNDYLRVSVSANNPIISEYYLNGKRVDKDVIKSMCLASEFPTNTEKPDTMTINIDNIITM